MCTEKFCTNLCNFFSLPFSFLLSCSFSLSLPLLFLLSPYSIYLLPLSPQGVTIHGGAPLFIFDENTAVILGIFQKATPTDLLDTVDTAAFHGQLPLQLRFSIVLEAPPLHIQDPEFMVRIVCVFERERVC